ncbi:uncharacterized protein LOC110370729 [Helicoverpa armigera]|uniref:uncharacterized protein LOC110370729 n=1 Tax=Helicoverpa armigera TaxID=29058 RepID=UPI00308326FF
MKKSTPTPKQLLKKRARNNKILLDKPNECSRKMLSEKKLKPLDHKNTYAKSAQFKTQDRKLKDDDYRNPYSVPERLRVTTKCLPPRKKKPVPFIMGDIHTVCDIDPSFYKIIEGRPIRSFYDIKTYMRHIRDITLFRADAGYLKEEIIQIETGIAEEQEEYARIVNLCHSMKIHFVVFAEESYKEAKRVQTLADDVAQKLSAVTDELEGYSFEFVRLKNEFSDIVAVYENLTRYKKFLTIMAPNWWRERYEGSCEKATALCCELFTNLESEEVELVTMYKKSAVTLARLEPELYFKKPIELSTLMDDAGRQCLNYLEIVAYFSSALHKIHKQRKAYKEMMIEQYEDLQSIIEYFLSRVKALEEKRDAYKAAFDRLLANEFYRLVASYDATKLFTSLQFVHTRLLNTKEDPRDTPTSLMLNIERLYFRLCENLEALDQKIVKVATKQIFDEDIRVMKQAHDAQRDLKEYDVLCKALYKSFEPSRKKTGCI